MARNKFSRVLLAGLITSFAGGVIDLVVSLIETFFFNHPLDLLRDVIVVIFLFVVGAIILFMLWRRK